MATLSGGASNTFGGEFQSLWIARLLIDVLRGAALWVRIEPGDAVASKTECIVCRADGALEAHQCKRQRGSTGGWSVADLEAEGIVSAAKQYLDKSSHHEFWFISGDPAPALRTLSERACQFDQLREFRAQAATNKATRRDFRALAALLGINADLDPDLERLRDFLQRLKCVTEDIVCQRREVEEYSSRWIEGEPPLIVLALEHLANTTVRRQLGALDLKTHLERNGFRLRDLTKEASLPLKLNEQCERYLRSFAPYLIGQQPLGRPETAEVLAAIEEPSSRVILLHGTGGHGKSGVLYETLLALQGKGEPCLPVRLDQDEVGATPAQLGKNLQLPASPVSSLESVAGNRRSVLIIDQLDAVRWTSQHSPRALDVVVALVEAALKRDSMKIVIACRTFDANDDDRIRTLFARLEKEHNCLRRVEIPALSDEARDVLLERLGMRVASLTAKQRETLRSLQNVWLLAKLQTDNGPTTFVSGADLNRKYWAWVRNQLSETERTSFDDRLLPRLLDSSSCADDNPVPMDLWSRHEAILKRLLSIGAIVRVGPKTVRFAHQTQFDYLAAERLSEQLRTGRERLVDWLVRHDELFHRNQLRQLLEMLRDDSPARFLEQTGQIVRDVRVRFHLKQVALQVIGSTDSPNDAELDLLLALDADSGLSAHIRELFQRNVGWFDLLHARGIVARWASAADEPTRGYARWMMRAFVRQRGEIISAIAHSLDEHACRGTLEAVLGYGELDELNDVLFRDFLSLIKIGSPATTYPDLKKLAARHPQRALAVFQAQSLRVLRSIEEADRSDTRRDRIEHVLLESKEQMRTVARRRPRAVWSALWPVVKRCEALRRRWRTRPANSGMVDFNDRQARARLAQVAEELVVAAGKRLACQNPELIWRLCRSHLDSGSRVHQRIALKALAGLPNEHADRVLGLLVEMPVLLQCGATKYGSRFRASATFPARRIIRRFSSHAGAGIVESVEHTVCSLIPRCEKELWRYAHDVFMGSTGRGTIDKCSIYPRTIFATQYVLLSAFDAAHLTSRGLDWRGVLERRFGAIESVLKQPPRSWGGFIGSSIPEERAGRLSDQSWLQLMRSEKVSSDLRVRGRRSRELVESSPELFARQLERAAERDPSRFASLLRRAPTNTRASYVAAIVGALGRDKPPEKAPADWAPAPVALVEAALTRFAAALADRQVALDYCWLLHHRADEPWSNERVAELVDLARSHPDPTGMEATIHDGMGATGAWKPNYTQTAINCVRGVAACAVSSLLWSDPTRLLVLQPAIDALADDPHPSVRIAATRIALPMLNMDRDQAITYCLKVNSHTFDAVLEGYELSEFFKYTLPTHFPRLEPLLRRMLSSEIDSVAKRGAEWSMALHLHDGRMGPDLESMVTGRLAHRQGMAEVLSRELVENPLCGISELLLTKLLNDAEKGVRDSAARLFWHPEFFQQQHAARLLEAFARSIAFVEESSDALHGLKETTARLDTFADAIGLMVDRIASIDKTSPGAPAFVGHSLPDVLLRLYEQSEAGSPARRRCLDFLDVALRDRIAYDLLPKIE
jgi:hypothetical protein